jgi:hypothetical protein
MAATATLLAAATSVTATAQTIGLTAGATFNTISGDDFDDFVESRTGFIGGVYLNFPLGGALSVEPAVLYAMKNVDFPDDDTELDAAYIQIPALLRYSFGAGGVKPALFAGPAANIQVSCDLSGTFAGDCEDQISDPESVQWTGIVGAGLGFGKLGVDVRYEFGLNDAFEDVDGKNATWSILARYALFGS